MRTHEYRCPKGHGETTVDATIGTLPETPRCEQCGVPMVKVLHAVPMFARWKRGR